MNGDSWAIESFKSLPPGAYVTIVGASNLVFIHARGCRMQNVREGQWDCDPCCPMPLLDNEDANEDANALPSV
jgi:hypothetical protein